ncbi:unnamed protein product [Onchocerca flexuosa]|uniref:Ovule protein n=1 Tax=Onchocerca flexuosa TaxID=387005 RepID=A0A183HF46_9BILA|nr:unnamed protein product [Onchocerca flexuosa]
MSHFVGFAYLSTPASKQASKHACMHACILMNVEIIYKSIVFAFPVLLLKFQIPLPNASSEISDSPSNASHLLNVTPYESN